jgi:hypothetical protein
MDKKVLQQAVLLKPILENIASALEKGKMARSLNFTPDELELVNDLHLITLKPMLYVCNVDEDHVLKDNEYVLRVKQLAASENNEVITLCGKIEAEISTLGSPEEKKEFLESLGLEESGLSKLIRSAYKLLGLATYFTAGEKEVRSWTIPVGAKAPQAAGVIHTDFERGFIKAEIYHYNDLLQFGSEAKVREAGKLRMEGKEYTVKDGDIIHFRFNV